FDPKPENETDRKLMVWSRRGSLNDRGRRADATERAQRREDRVRVATSRGRQESQRSVSGDGGLAAGVLQLEAALCGAGVERTTGAAPAAGRKPQAQDLSGGSHLAQAHPAG